MVYEVTWIKKVLTELKVNVHSVPYVYCDNISVGCLAKNLVLHSRIKHLDIYFFLVREKVMSGEFNVEYTMIAGIKD